MVEPVEGAAAATAGADNASVHGAGQAQAEQEALETTQVQDGARFRLTLSEVSDLQARKAAEASEQRWPALEKLATYDAQHSAAVSETLTKLLSGDFMKPVEKANAEAERLMEAALQVEDPAERARSIAQAESEAWQMQLDSYLRTNAEVIAAQSQINVRLGISSMLKETITMAVKAFNKVTSGR